MIADCPEEEEIDDAINADKFPTDDPIPEISFHAMSGANHPQTICVISRLKNKEVTVLIDGGGTHNFIDQSIVSNFGLPMVRDGTF